MIFGYIDPGTGFTATSLAGILLAFLSGLLSIIAVFFKKIFNFFRQNKRWSIVCLLLMGTCVFAGSHFVNQHKKVSAQRVIVIGFDALSPRIMEPMMVAGKLKNFARLKAMGGYSPLATTTPPESPVAWSAFSTGQNPGKNGIFDFITRDPKNYRLSLSLSNTEGGVAKSVIKSPRFWQHLAQKKIPAVILGCPVSFPPDRINGKMLSGMGVPDVLGTEGTFLFYTSLKDEGESNGGKVFYVKKSPMILNYFWGPRVEKLMRDAENVSVPFKVTFPSRDEVLVEYQKKKVELKVGQWSGWQDITFDLGLMRKSKAIFKFYLVEANPEFKLYVSPFNLDPRDPFFPISYPEDYSRKLSEEIGLFHTQGMPFDTWALNEGRLDEKAFLEQAEDVLGEREKMLALELKRFEKGVFYFYFEDVDIIQHMFWRYTDPGHPLYDVKGAAQYKNIIEEWYQKMDGILGTVMDQLKPDDVLLVLSDHGFDTYRRTVHLNSWLRDNGYLELKDEGALSGDALLKSIDWTKTKAYAIGFGSIYVNEKGREARGIVSTEEKRSLKKEIAEQLQGWIDPKTKSRVVNKVYPQEEVFWGKHSGEAPDLVVGFNLGYGASWQTALGASPQELIEDNLRKWSGSHLFDSRLVDGVLFSNQSLNKEHPAIMDLAPTILHLTGFSDVEIKKCDFDGETLIH